SEVLEVWNGVYWENDMIWIYTYNTENNLETYMLQLWNGSSFVFQDYIHIFYRSVIGIEDLLSIDYPITIFPIPATQEIRVHSAQKYPNIDVTFSVINLLGETIHKRNTIWSNEISLSIQSLTPGIYFLKMESERGDIVKRFIKD
ncbi:MAG: T9SS type A sorting domain-containing protein, partial [Bacteroidia bacterium]|nr:T9SS type A sorting domain-containing protein [Bacteroidia bacterium]